VNTVAVGGVDCGLPEQRDIPLPSDISHPVTEDEKKVAADPRVRVQFAFIRSAVQVPRGFRLVAGSWDFDTTNVLLPVVREMLVGGGDDYFGDRA